MIVKEKISGYMYRIYPNIDNPAFDAVWVLTDERDIKGLMFKIASKEAREEFFNWLDMMDDIKAETAIHSVEVILKRFGFKELVKEKDLKKLQGDN